MTNTIRDFGGDPVTVAITDIEVGVFDLDPEHPGDPYVDFPAIEITAEHYLHVPSRSDVARVTLDPAQASKLAHRILELATPLAECGPIRTHVTLNEDQPGGQP
ncbi:MAG: hypothetical protein ACLP3C_15640 [Mycobacterium sp.]|uniref:hypothetical protein n=1 Tax=Mycobacterium sp. TaxID=1785 RepID=UPI003F9D1BB9